jgi:hypothetical protein
LVVVLVGLGMEQVMVRDCQVLDNHVQEEETQRDRSEYHLKRWRLFNVFRVLDSLRDERHKPTSLVTKMKNSRQTFYLNPSQKKRSLSCRKD